MNDMRCSEIDELLAVYAADALDDDERLEVAVHLAECRNHDAELAALRADFERLALVPAVIEPPAGLRASLLDAFDREVAGEASAPVAAPSPAPVSMPQQAAPAREPTPRSESRPRVARGALFAGAGFGYALAAALLVVAVGLGAWGLSRDSGDAGGIVQAVTTEGGHSLELTYLQERHVAVLDVDLSAPPEGHSYQAWQIVDGQPVSVGVLSTHSGEIAFAADLDRASAIALSVEPTGGSQAPTTTPILVTELPES